VPYRAEPDLALPVSACFASPSLLRLTRLTKPGRASPAVPDLAVPSLPDRT